MTTRFQLIWVADGVQRGVDGGLTSTLASTRYRVLSPMASLAAEGYSVRRMDFATWLDVPLASFASCRAVVVGKLLAPSGQTLSLGLQDDVLSRISVLRAEGVKVLADFCDDHFDRAQDGAYWTQLARSVDVCVAGSEVMGQRLGEVSKRPVAVVGDPVASPEGVPRVYRGARSGFSLGAWRPFGTHAAKRVQLAWYGHPSNWQAFFRWAETLAQAKGLPPLILWAVTTPLPQILRQVEVFNSTHAGRVTVELVSWTEADQWAVLADAEVVLLPADLSDQRKAVKTANRLIDALHSGCFVIASPVPSYQAFAAHVSLGDDPVRALMDYLAHPDQALEAVRAGQSLVKQVAGPEAIAKQWGAAFALADASADRPDAGSQFEPRVLADVHRKAQPLVRLNIGCGDKILPDYINVDVVQSRAGKAPDVIADVRDLSVFETGYADEVMAIHVVEHFWRWEVEDVIREWVRVLKPGGRLVLECPNLLAACEALLANPALAARADQAGQRSMWVFYGDPQWKDPLMIHRWGYTPDSLMDMLRSLGLMDVRQEPAQYKLREPRDMRVVGFKPSC